MMATMIVFITCGVCLVAFMGRVVSSGAHRPSVVFAMIWLVNYMLGRLPVVCVIVFKRLVFFNICCF